MDDKEYEGTVDSVTVASDNFRKQLTQAIGTGLVAHGREIIDTYERLRATDKAYNLQFSMFLANIDKSMYKFDKLVDHTKMMLDKRYENICIMREQLLHHLSSNPAEEIAYNKIMQMITQEQNAYFTELDGLLSL